MNYKKICISDKKKEFVNEQLLYLIINKLNDYPQYWQLNDTCKQLIIEILKNNNCVFLSKKDLEIYKTFSRQSIFRAFCELYDTGYIDKLLFTESKRVSIKTQILLDIFNHKLYEKLTIKKFNELLSIKTSLDKSLGAWDIGTR